MAASDLLAELGRDSLRLDADLERRLCGAVALQLDDASGDVSGLAVKWCACCSRFCFCCCCWRQQRRRAVYYSSDGARRALPSCFALLLFCVLWSLSPSRILISSRPFRWWTPPPTPRSLALLVRRVSEPAAVAAVNDLAARALSAKKDAARDVAAIALKAVVAELPPGARGAGAVAGAIAEGMLAGLDAHAVREIGGACARVLVLAAAIWAGGAPVAKGGAECVLLLSGAL